jgi:hypothetical protein
MRIVQVLRTGDGDLDKYVFSNLQHAVEWMSQKFVTPEKYWVELWYEKRVNCQCGRGPYSKLISRVFSREDLECG